MCQVLTTPSYGDPVKPRHHITGKLQARDDMKHIFGAIKNKHVRASAQSGLNGSATLPTSGSTAVDNLTGASRAASELSAGLDAALDQIKFQRYHSPSICLWNMRITICRRSQCPVDR